MALAHEFNDEMTAHNADYLLTDSGGGSRADIVVDVQPRPDDGRIPYPAAHLEGQSACRTRAGKVTVSIQRNYPNGIVILDIDDRLILCGLEPFLPRLPGRFGQQILLLESVCQCKLERTLAHQHNVRRLFHHHARNGNGVLDVFEESHGSAVTMLIHNAGVEGYVTDTVWKASIAHRLHCRICFCETCAGFHGIQRASAVGKDFPGLTIRIHSEIPGGEDYRLHRRIVNVCN